MFHVSLAKTAHLITVTRLALAHALTHEITQGAL